MKRMKKIKFANFKIISKINILLLLSVIIACGYSQPSSCARLENKDFKVKLIKAIYLDAIGSCCEFEKENLDAQMKEKGTPFGSNETDRTAGEIYAPLIRFKARARARGQSFGAATVYEHRNQFSRRQAGRTSSRIGYLQFWSRGSGTKGSWI